jgi:hypothetical protein
MAMDKRFDSIFTQLRQEFTRKTERTFIQKVEDALEDRPDLQDILARRRVAPRYVAVTFDRRKNDKAFSYPYFDILLVMLDRLSGGHGIYKPANQLRAIRWNADRADLVRLLRYLAPLFPQVNYRRLLVLPFPRTLTGHRIDGQVHLR